MHKNKRTFLRKKFLSLLVASAMTCSQVLTVMPGKVTAAGTGSNVSNTVQMLLDGMKRSAANGVWEDGTSLPTSGTYKLDCDITASSITVSGTRWIWILMVTPSIPVLLSAMVQLSSETAETTVLLKAIMMLL